MKARDQRRCWGCSQKQMFHWESTGREWHPAAPGSSAGLLEGSRLWWVNMLVGGISECACGGGAGAS